MKTIVALFKRNLKLFFKDKGMFFTSLITPMILLVLYATFLANVYRDSFTMNLPKGINVDNQLIDGLVGGQLISSLLAVSCVTVAFCSNFLMVQDKVNGTVKDFLISPIKPTTLSIGYYLSNLVSTLIVCFTATIICLLYILSIGWYLSFADVALLFLDVIILVLFGTILSSVVNFFLSSQGQISAVGTIISSVYGFLCGAYMPISSFGKGLQNALSFLPGTYGTSLMRKHAMNGALVEMGKHGVPEAVINSMRDGVDCNVYFFDNLVSTQLSYIILILAIVILFAIYVSLNLLKHKNKK